MIRRIPQLCLAFSICWAGHSLAKTSDATNMFETYDTLPAPVATGLTKAWRSVIDAEQPNIQYTALRTVFNLPPDPSNVVAHVTAGTQYRLYVNGEFVATGPAPATMGYRFVDSIPLDQWAGGESLTVALEWIYLPYKGGSSEFPEHVPGISFVLEADGAVIQPATPWRYRWFHALDQDAPLLGGSRKLPLETVDLAKIPDDWTRPGFNDADWKTLDPAGEAADTPHFLARPVPMPPFRLVENWQPAEAGLVRVEGTEASACEIWEKGNFLPGGIVTTRDAKGKIILSGQDKGLPYVLLDLGEPVAGHLVLDANIPKGVRLDAAFIQDVNRFDGHPWRDHIYNVPSRFTLSLLGDGGDAIHESAHLYSARFLLLVASGLKPGQSVVLNRAGVRERTAVDPHLYTATMRCSDPELNEAFDASLRALQLNTLDFPIDGMPDENKMYVEYCARPGYPAFHLFQRQSPGFVTGVLDMLLTTRGSRRGWETMPEAAVRQTAYPYFNIDVVFSFAHAVNDLSRYRGVKPPEGYVRALAEMLDELDQHANADGLLESLPNTNYGHGLALTIRGRMPYGDPIFDGIHTMTQADYYSTLRLMEKWTGDRRFRDRAEKLRKGFNKLLQSGREGEDSVVTVLGGQVGSIDRKAHSRIHQLIPDAFVKQDGQWVPFSVPEVHIFEADSIWRSEACQYTVLDSGILDPKTQDALWDILLRWSPYEIPTEDDAKTFNVARAPTYPAMFYRYRELQRCGRPDLLYADLKGMVEQTRALTQWSADDARERGGGGIENSMYATLLFEALTGITPGEDGGYDHAVIRPLPTPDLRWARGSLETANGMIGSRWHQEAGGFDISVTLPEDVKADVILPPEALAFALRGGHPVNPGGRYPISHSSTLSVTQADGVQINSAD